MPTQHDIYGSSTLEALNEIAELLAIARSLREIKAQFKNHPHIDFKVATKNAVSILKILRAASVDLLKVSFSTNDEERLRQMFILARREHSANLLRAVQLADELNDQEFSALEGDGIKANFVLLKVLNPLRGVAGGWSAA